MNLTRNIRHERSVLKVITEHFQRGYFKFVQSTKHSENLFIEKVKIVEEHSTWKGTKNFKMHKEPTTGDV